MRAQEKLMGGPTVEMLFFAVSHMLPTRHTQEMEQWSSQRHQMLTEALDILALLLLSTDGEHLQLALMHEGAVPTNAHREPKKVEVRTTLDQVRVGR